ncbi:hypothetical protein [Hydrogenophaga sp. PAMC20947]|uniref:hypothetical protein n=1 Tax=Hydrogenophaga sp. PAMC20947 TaxID=2565558 RepID=UPI001447BD2F|nr:hypothetical protein [Hydrogenophaga sp. PAMC20947]
MFAEVTHQAICNLDRDSLKINCAGNMKNGRYLALALTDPRGDLGVLDLADLSEFFGIG